MKSKEIESYIAQQRSIPEDIYPTMCFDGYQQKFLGTMKLFKFELLIPPSTANAERGFSTMNLPILPLRTLLGEKNLDLRCLFVWTGQKSSQTRQLRN